ERSPEPMLPLEDEPKWVEPPDPEPVIQLREPEPSIVPREEPELLLSPAPHEPVEPLELAGPQPALPEPLALERLKPPEPLEPLEPLEPRVSREDLEPRNARVWPIGLACLVGLAVGFGAGYIAASRPTETPVAPVAADVHLPPERTTAS